MGAGFPRVGDGGGGGGGGGDISTTLQPIKVVEVALF